MEKGDLLYQQYVNILKEELRTAMGCTEPVALAYAGAISSGCGSVGWSHPTVSFADSSRRRGALKRLFCKIEMIHL